MSEARAYLVLCGLVMLGSLIGGTARVLVGWSLAHSGWLPWGTLAVNVLGSFAIGAYAALSAPGGRLRAGPRQRQFVMTGICGGFTTFSLFGLETVNLAGTGQVARAIGYVALSLVLWFLAVGAGHALCARGRPLGEG